MKTKSITKRNMLLGGLGAVTSVAAAGLFGGVALDASVPFDDTILSNDGIPIGTVKEFLYPNVIDLWSDKRNLTVKSHVTLPPGWVIESAQFIVHVKKHTVTYSHQIDQPQSVSLSQETLVHIANKAKSAVGMFSGKAKIEASGKLSAAAAAVRHRFALDATSHGRVRYTGWADGKRYSSKDGVIRASLSVTARRAPTADEVDATLATLAAKLADANTSMLRDAVKALQGIKDATKPATA
ncbi:hypothetical protein [Rubrimonas cliftonensis]|uniref:Uncharacterized protein n=1 Tax=Rubrimonas cliftonensis TaxID=89524 RepID=A0A1H4FZX3_9RHOB|nr:hypothetical protein [Rubrimonas cliftonensis]SEB02032.1 hypothetical protein SAMN05444370_1311 [Rubrimonas cliftonensis]